MAKKVIGLITLDYELFLGRNYFPPEEVLFQPTRKILNLAQKLNFPVTLFSDVCSVWAHRQNGLDSFADGFEAQLKDAIRAGHGVELHLHPHWLSSCYKEGEWLISTDKMYLHELGYGDGPQSAGAFIASGVRYLNDLLRPVDPAYSCSAFRAAGAALQPDEDKLIGALLTGGLKVDSSVINGLVLKIDTVKINYTKTPQKTAWYMSPESGIHQEARDGLLEFPVASFHGGLGTRIGFLIRRARSVGQMRGSTISRTKRQSRLANARNLALLNLRYVLGNPCYIFSCDTKGFNGKMLMNGFRQYVTRHRDEDTIFVTMLNHPKLMFDKQINMLGEFVERAREECDITFVTCAEAYKYHNNG